MTRLSKTLQLALSLATMVGGLMLTSAHATAQGQAAALAAGQALEASQEPALQMLHGWMPAAPRLPLEDSAEYAEATERPSESEGDEGHGSDHPATPAAAVLELLRDAAHRVPRVEKQSCSPQAAVSTGAPRGPPQPLR